MSSVPKDSKVSVKRKPSSGRRRRRRSEEMRRRRLLHARGCRAGGGRSIGNSGTGGAAGRCSKVSDKLVALRSLIPTHKSEVVKADQLFQETAEYIVKLRTQVHILQSLIEFYGSGERENNAAS